MARSIAFAATAAAVAFLAAPAAAEADQVITTPGKYFEPANVTVLTGEPVTWHNEDAIEHDVAAVPFFVSGPLASGTSYTYAFSTPGTYAFRCTIHAFMTGSVTVAPVILQAPPGAVLAGQGLRLTGRAPAGTAHVAIERTLDGTTWQDTGATVVPDASGAFAATVPAAEGATYRADVAGGTSAVVTPQVAARVPLAVRVARSRHHLAVHVRTGSRGTGLYAGLETYRRWHFVWRPVGKRVRIGPSGRTTFQVPVALRSRAHVVLYGHRAGTPLLTSRPVRLSDGRPTFEPIPAPMHGGHGPAADGTAPMSGTPAPAGASARAAGSHAGHPAG
jgi:plastocyanin